MYTVIIPYPAHDCVKNLTAASDFLAAHNIEHEFLISENDKKFFEKPEFRAVSSKNTSAETFLHMIHAAAGEKICCFFGAEYLSEKVPAKLFFACNHPADMVCCRIKGKPRSLLNTICFETLSSILHLCFAVPYFDTLLPFSFVKKAMKNPRIDSRSDFYSAEFLIRAHKKCLRIRDVNIFLKNQNRPVKLPEYKKVILYIYDLLALLIQFPKMQRIMILNSQEENK